MVIKLFNTLSGKKEEFNSITPKKVGIYNCGPTVYNFAHIGNLRAYVFADVLRRTLEYNGYEVNQVMNITDIGHLSSDADDGEDKMTKALKREGKPMTLTAMREVADFYTEKFVADLKALNIKLPKEMPSASDNIEEDIEIIKILEEKGIAYKISDGLYFDTAQFADYGKLGNVNLNGQESGARVAVNSEKRNPRDFALWKFASGEIGWQSPWGKGFPGWHIECSAMSRKFLGQPFDIHTGGIDHIAVHHNNEIAQSESAFGVPLANYWLHNEFVNVSSGKMAKSAENFLTLGKLVEQDLPPLAYRYFLLLANYRTPIVFHGDIIEKIGKVSLERLSKILAELPTDGSVNKDYARQFLEAINNDLNTAEGLALVYKILDDGAVSPADKLATIIDFDRVLGLGLEQSRGEAFRLATAKIPDEVQKLVTLRENAREGKDWKKSDELRDKIKALGYEINDTDSGATVQKKIIKASP